MTGLLTDSLAWLVVGSLTGGVLWQSRNRQAARSITVGAWMLFALYWALLVPHFAFEQKSIIEGAGAILAVPASLYAGYLLWSGRDPLFVLSRAVALMGLVYLPFITVPSIARVLIEIVTAQSHLVMEIFGYSPSVVRGDSGYWSTFLFVGPAGHRYLTTVLLACTGIGSTSIMIGIIGAVKAPLRRRLQAIALVVPTIWVLNLVRVSFITVATGKQWFRIQPLINPVLFLFGSNDVHEVSYFVADRLLAQSLSVVALLILIWAISRLVPEVLSLVEEVLAAFTNREFDLQRTIGHA